MPEEKQCAKPTINYKRGKLTFSCDTEGAEIVTEITDSDIKKYHDAVIDLTATYPATAEGQQKFTVDLIAKLKAHRNVDGLFWWWPEANEKGIYWKNSVTKDWYNAGLFDNNTGCALPALYELKTFK